MSETPNMSVLQQYIHTSRYARWLPEEGRRETWDETVDRYVDFFEQHIEENTKGSIKNTKQELRDAIYKMEVMPSMRALMTAGPALERETLPDIIVALLPWIPPVHLTRLCIFL